MLYLIKFIFLLFISHYAFANENKSSQILFKINNKVFTNTDLEKRKEYVGLINKYTSYTYSESENKEILNDYISALIFYEYYNKNKKLIKNLNKEIDILLKKNLKDFKKFDQTSIKQLKLNTKIDLIRNKIIEQKLNSNKKNLFKEANKLDLLYNYNLQYIIINENLIDNKLINNINDNEKFNNLKNFLKKNNINFLYKEEDINNNKIISNKIKNIIDQNIQIYIDTENQYINLISIRKSLTSYEGIYVKLINFKSNTPFDKEDLQCDKLNEIGESNKTVFKEYEYSKLNNYIKNNLKSINDYILFNESNEYNYVVLCDITYNEELLKKINLNKNINSLVNKFQKQFLIKYKNEYKFVKIK